MTDEAVKASVAALLGVLDFDTEAAAQSIDAVTELYRRIRRLQGGVGTLKLSLSASPGQKLIPHNPVIVPPEEIVHRRRA
jgi:hypothetical protein